MLSVHDAARGSWQHMVHSRVGHLFRPVRRVGNSIHPHAVHALLRWYRDDSDPQAKLPILAAAMGHVSVVSTAYYLPFLEPLAQAASRRFARHARWVLGGPRPGGDRG